MLETKALGRVWSDGKVVDEGAKIVSLLFGVVEKKGCLETGSNHRGSECGRHRKRHNCDLSFLGWKCY